jgi:ABC-2 type transport system ATP-binding protein
MNAPRLLEVQNLGFTANQKTILRDLSFTIKAGEAVAVVGHNGAGKTTLFHLIFDLKHPTQGQIFLNQLTTTDPKSRVRVSFVPERPYLDLDQSGFEAVLFYLRLTEGKKIENEHARVVEALNRVGLANAAQQKMKLYSKGMLQRTLMAQALVSSHSLLVLDEPMSGLDPDGRIWLKQLLSQLRSEGKTILFSTHTLDDVKDLADQVLVLEQGAMKYFGAVDGWSA